MENLLKEFSNKTFTELNLQFQSENDLNRDLFKIFIQYVPTKTFSFLKLFDRLEKVNFLLDILLDIYNNAILEENYEQIYCVIRYLYFLRRDSKIIKTFTEKVQLKNDFFTDEIFINTDSKFKLNDFNWAIDWVKIENYIRPYENDTHIILHSTIKNLFFNSYKAQNELNGFFLKMDDLLKNLIECLEYNFPFFTRYLIQLSRGEQKNLIFIISYFKNNKRLREVDKKFIAFLYENIFTNQLNFNLKNDFKKILTDEVEMEIRSISNINVFNDFMDREREILYKYSNEDYNELYSFAFNSIDPLTFNMEHEKFIPLFFNLTRPSITHFLTYFKFFKPYILNFSEEEKEIFFSKIKKNSEKRNFYEKIILKKIKFLF